MNKGGGSAAFGRWAKKTVHTRAGAQLMTMLLGVLSVSFNLCIRGREGRFAY